MKHFFDKFLGFSAKDWKELKSNLKSDVLMNKEDNVFIMEKLRKFCSFYGPNLAFESRRRFKKEASFQLENIIDVFLSTYLKNISNNHLPKNIPIDPAFINATLYCYDALVILKSKNTFFYSKQIKNKLRDLEIFLTFRKKNLSKDKNFLNNNLYNESKNFLKVNNIKFKNQSIVIFSPGPDCKNTKLLIELCIRYNVPLKGILIKKKFSFSRIKELFQNDWIKIFSKLFLKKSNNNFHDFKPINNINNILDTEFANIYKLTKAYNIPIKKVNNFDQAKNFLRKNKSTIGLFLGGGIITKKIINCFSIGIVNAHKGILPFYKGMHVAQASISEGRWDLVGITTHLIEEGIDTGPIIKFYRINPFEYSRIENMKIEMSNLTPFLILNSCLSLIYDYSEINIQESIGRQYYIMHNQLKKIIQSSFDKHLGIKKTEISKDITKILDLLK